MSPDLAEIAEAEARGRTARIYAEIRAAFGLPIVNLVYRALAASGDLEAVWGELAPNLRDGSVVSAAAELVGHGTPPQGGEIPPAALKAAGVDDTLRQQALTTIDAYVYANPVNLVAVSALLEPGRASTPSAAAGNDRPFRDWQLLPMADLADLDPRVRALLDEMSRPLTAPGRELLVPSLFRHFAGHSCLLALLWTSIAPAVRSGEVTRAADIVLSHGREAAKRLPHPVNRLEEPGARDLLKRFQFTIARMIVLSVLMRRALRPERSRPEHASS
ncbi:MAG: hypothetical protein OXG37_13100 [Actinomycetia bacterium]|nr:hypothetical protein [Actinomycetes bacterium]